MFARRFPYAIYYEKRQEDGEIVVLRVLDCREEPEKSKNKLK